MSESCRDWRGDLAADALGRLDADAHLALQAHLDGCAACRAELAELTPVARALPAADADRVIARTSLTEPPAGLADRVLGSLAFARAKEHRRNRRRAGIIAGSVAAVAAAIIGVLIVAASLQSVPQRSDRTIAFAVAPQGVDATATLHNEEYGTEVKLVIDGLNDGEWYWLWLTGSDGNRVSAGTFRASGEHFTAEMTSALPLRHARRIWVTDAGDHVVFDSHISQRA
jgi:anti-sigma-K factor RskA